jgi:F-type H+-transporting ATPase subunit b
MPAQPFTASLVSLAAAVPQSPDQQLLDIDGTFFVMLGIFLLAMAVLNQLLWKPYLRIRGERVARIDGYKAEAKRLDADATDRLAKVESQLADARRAGSAERARARAAAQAKEQEILAAAQREAMRALGEARVALETAMADERKTLEVRAQDLGRQAAERVLGRRVA